jgi:hypothetical protein
LNRPYVAFRATNTCAISSSGSKTAVPCPSERATHQSHYALAVTVLLHITQYTRYLGQLGKDSHSDVLDSVNGGGGIQGFCVGLLSAPTVATSASELDIGASAAVALRLAVCIGAYVDHDALDDEILTVALRWGDGHVQTNVEDIIRSIPDVRQHWATFVLS